MLTAARFGPVELDLCLSCSGVFFDTGELGRVITGGPQIIRRLAERLPLGGRNTAKKRPLGEAPCSACRAPLRSVEYASMPGVRLDACQFCEGFWVTRAKLLLLADSLGGRNVYSQVAATGSPDPGAAPAVTAAPPPAAPLPPPKPATPASVPCPHCAEPNAENAAVCWACGKSLKAQALAVCPRCEAVMRNVQSDAVSFSSCEGCGSIYITPNRLNQLILQDEDKRHRVLRHVGRFEVGKIRKVHADTACPHCRTPMLPAHLGRICPHPVPSCPQCFGLLVEHGVLTEILLR
jgi:Zn-finger nucleic acid-binding protein